MESKPQEELQLGTGIYRNLHKNVIVQENKRFGGKGLFVINEMIPAGTVVFKNLKGDGLCDNHLHTWSEVQNLPEEERKIFLQYGYQVSDDLYAGLKTKEEIENRAVSYYNHSCDPTTWILDDDTCVARRDMQVGEEMTIDYGTYEGEKEGDDEQAMFNFECKCGASDCRGIVRTTDYKDETFRNKYYPHFQAFLLERIHKYLKEKAEADLSSKHETH